ncbi:MAG: PTS sugar transporter subunit IIA [Spirochaetales bacterium]|nr:PTS sugar transporter subunit IIA [Spirochaetales bacterium]
MEGFLQDDILTLSELAEYLKVSEKTMLKMVNAGEIPAAKIGNQWRFSRAIINDWLVSKMEVVPQNDLSMLIEGELDFVPLSRLLSKDGVILDMKAGDRDSALARLAGKAFELSLVADEQELTRLLIQREDMMSTALDNGIALPHVRTLRKGFAAGPGIIIGMSGKGINFNLADQKKTFLFFLIVSDSEAVHLRIMAKLARILRNTQKVEHLRSFKRADEFIGFFIEEEKRLNFTVYGEP